MGQTQRVGGRKKIILGVGALVVLGLTAAGVGVLFRFWDFGRRASKIDERVAEYRAAGLPWVATDIAPPVPDSENAAKPLTAALEALNHAALQKARASWNKDAAAARFDVLAKSLKPFEKALNLSHAVRPFAKADFGWNLDKGANVEYHELSAIRSLVIALCFRAEVHFGQGRPEEAVKDWTAAMHLVKITSLQPGMLPALVAVAQYKFAVRSLCRAESLSSTPLPAAARGLLDAQVPVDLDRTFRGELYSTIATCRNLQNVNLASMMGPAGPSLVPDSQLLRDGLPAGTTQRAFLVAALDYWQDFFKLKKAAGNDLVAFRKSVEAKNAEIESSRSLSNFLLKVIVPVYPEAIDAATSAHADRAMAQTYIRALDYRRQHGRLPADPADLGEMPDDPFSGEPIIYKARSNGFIVYSVGRNGRDDNGKRGQDGDLVIEYPMP